MSVKKAMGSCNVDETEIARLLQCSVKEVRRKIRQNDFYLSEGNDIMNLFNNKGGGYDWGMFR